MSREVRSPRDQAGVLSSIVAHVHDKQPPFCLLPQCREPRSRLKPLLPSGHHDPSERRRLTPTPPCAAGQAQQEELLAKHAAGELSYQASEALLTESRAAAKVSTTSDGFVRVGDVVILRHPASGAAVACLPASYNTGEADMPVVGCTDKPATSRSAFIIHAAKPGPGALEGDIVKYGDRVRLECRAKPTCRLPPGASTAYLYSERTGLHNTAARFSGQQRVSCSGMDPEVSLANYNWEFVSGDMEYRLEDEGQPVSANAPLLLKHCLSNQRLAVLQQHLWRSEHGVDFEVTAHTHLTKAKADGPENVLVVEMETAAAAE